MRRKVPDTWWVAVVIGVVAGVVAGTVAALLDDIASPRSLSYHLQRDVPRWVVIAVVFILAMRMYDRLRRARRHM